MSVIINERMAEIEGISLKSGSHKQNSSLNACVMEAVAYVAGEPWSDAPQPEGYTLRKEPDEPVIEPMSAIRLVVICALCLLAVALIGVAAAWPFLARYFN